jgi:predicted nucleic acid-binding Zn ribbon protein
MAGLGAVLDELLQGREWAAGKTLGDLARRWGEVVGERLAEECSPEALEGGTLLIRVSSSGWARQVSFLKREVRERANALLGQPAVREVKVTLASPRRAQ